LDEVKVEKMSIVVNRIEFPALPKRQQVPRQRGFDSSVWKTPLAIVAKIDDTIQKNIDAPIRSRNRWLFKRSLFKILISLVM
jgi:hypothetical protein